MNDINRRLFVSIVLLITLLGTAGILYYSVTHLAGQEEEKPASDRDKPAYVTALGAGNESRLQSPLHLAVSDGLAYISSSGNGRLTVYSQTGTFKKSLELKVSDAPSSPLGVAIDGKRHIYVATTRSTGDAILVFDNSGRYLYTFPEGASGDASYIAPGKAMALFAGDGKLYVTDIVDQDIKVYDLSGNLLKRFGRPGAAKGEFLFPNGITADASGTIYISDSNNGRVQVFDENGEFLYLFNQPDNDQLALPRGIAIDHQDRVHVVDTLKHKVFVFTKKGGFLYSYGTFGTGEGGLSYPNGIAIDKATGKIYIADKMNNRISVWK